MKLLQSNFTSYAFPFFLRMVGVLLAYRSGFMELMKYYPHLAAPVLLFTLVGLILWSWTN